MPRQDGTSLFYERFDPARPHEQEARESPPDGHKETQHPWKRFVALGDSLTEGVGDPRANGTLRGWADRLADGLAAADGFDYYNLARLGIRTRGVREQQLPKALDLEPDLASVLTGMNDVLSPSLGVGSFTEDLATIITQLQQSGALVFTACLPRTVPALRVCPASVRRNIESRLETVSAGIRDVAAESEVLCLDIEDLPGDYGLDVCSIDGIHPNARGHLLIAQAFARKLSALRGRTIAPPNDAETWPTTSLRHLRWLIRGGHLRAHPSAKFAKGFPRASK